jgi:hypothetical protein
LGCTEIPLALDRKKYTGNCILIDPTEILATAAVDTAIRLDGKLNEIKFSKNACNIKDTTAKTKRSLSI